MAQSSGKQNLSLPDMVSNQDDQSNKYWKAVLDTN